MRHPSSVRRAYAIVEAGLAWHGHCISIGTSAAITPRYRRQMVTEKRKGNSVVTVSYADNLMHIEVLGAGSIVFDKARASRECRAEAEDHGWEQRLRDAAAIGRDEDTGASATPQDKYARVAALAEYYMTGATEWARVGQGGGGRSLTVEAIARVKGVEYPVAEAYVADFAKAKHGGDTRKALAFLRTAKAVMEAMDAIRKERLPTPAVDADKALEELA